MHTLSGLACHMTLGGQPGDQTLMSLTEAIGGYQGITFDRFESVVPGTGARETAFEHGRRPQHVRVQLTAVCTDSSACAELGWQ